MGINATILKEEYQWANGFEGMYKVSNYGNVKSYLRKRKQVLKPIKMPNGTNQWSLRRNGKNVRFTLDELF
jgi:hypothetical protein